MAFAFKIKYLGCLSAPKQPPKLRHKPHLFIESRKICIFEFVFSFFVVFVVFQSFL